MKQLNLTDFQAVAFDVDGTLADTIPTHHAARMLAFAECGYGDITPEQHHMGPTYGSSTADIVGGILHAAGKIEKTGLFKDHPAVKAIIQSKMRYFEELTAGGFAEMPGAVDFVKSIIAHFPNKVALVTSSEKRFVLPFLKRYGLADIFSPDFVITEDTILENGLEGKPAPDAYTLAMQRLHAPKLLVFEDTVSGTTSAKTAGATVIALGFDQQSSKLFAGNDLRHPPDAFVQNYDEAATLLGL